MPNAKKSFTQNETEQKPAEPKPEKEKSKPQTVGDILETVEITPEIHSTESGKRGRGRPKKEAPKEKPKWNKGIAYKDNMIADVLNDTIALVLNKTVLKDNNVKPSELEIGQAVCYTLEYYLPNIPLDHPIMILALAAIGTVFLVNTKRKAAKETKEINPQETKLEKGHPA